MNNFHSNFYFTINKSWHNISTHRILLFADQLGCRTKKDAELNMASSHESSLTLINISGNSEMTEEESRNFDTEKGEKRQKISHLRQTAQSKISTAAKKASNTFNTTNHSIAHKFDKVREKMSSQNPSTHDIVPVIETPNDTNDTFNEKIAGLQDLVHQTKVSMQNNVNLVVERGANLDRLSVRAETLANGSIEFKTKAKKVKHKTWFEMWKMRILVGSIFALIIIVVIAAPVVKIMHDHHKDKPNREDQESENTTTVSISS